MRSSSFRASRWLTLGVTGFFSSLLLGAEPSAASLDYSSLTRLSFPDLKSTLEQAGWPAPHVQAILGAEIQRRLNPPREIKASDLRSFEFWRTGPDALPLPPSTRGRAEEQAKHEEAARVAFDNLFPASSTEDSNAALLAWEEQRRWGNLSADKRSAASTLLASAEKKRHALFDQRGGILTRAEWDVAWKITEEVRADLAHVLSAGELLDYDLRNSVTAERMRNELDNFQPTRAEFITIFQLRHTLELNFGHKPQGVDSHVDEQRSAAEATVEKQIAAALGPSRYDDYRLSLEPACQTLQFDGRFARSDATTIRKLYRSLLSTKTRLADTGAADAAPLKDALYREFRAVLDEEGTRRYLQEQGLWP